MEQHALDNTQSSSPLLRLPGELRNRIYEDALASDEIIAFHEDVPKLSPYFTDRLRDRVNDFNQIKYVCHQLYWETAGTEVQNNNLLFYRAEPFTNLLATCTKKKATWLCKVKIVWTGPDGATYNVVKRKMVMLQLSNCCIKHPDLKIDYTCARFGVVSTQGNLFLDQGVFLTRIVRGKDAASRYPINVMGIIFENYVKKFWNSNQDDDSPIRLDLPNLQFWPALGSNYPLTEPKKFEAKV